MGVNRLLYAILLVFLGCNQAGTPEKTKTPASENQSENLAAKDSAVQLLQHGDLVFRLGNDVTSAMLSQLNQRDKSFSHCGIASFENGNFYIYHSIGGEFNPDQKIKRESCDHWFSNKNNLSIGIYRLHLDSSKKRNVIESVKSLYQQGRKFDMEFDLETDDRLYCAEMIYKSILYTVKKEDYIPITKVFNKEYVGIDDLFLNENATPICRVQYK